MPFFRNSDNIRDMEKPICPHCDYFDETFGNIDILVTSALALMGCLLCRSNFCCQANITECCGGRFPFRQPHIKKWPGVQE